MRGHELDTELGRCGGYSIEVAAAVSAAPRGRSTDQLLSRRVVERHFNACCTCDDKSDGVTRLACDCRDVVSVASQADDHTTCIAYALRLPHARAGCRHHPAEDVGQVAGIARGTFAPQKTWTRLEQTLFEAPSRCFCEAQTPSQRRTNANSLPNRPRSARTHHSFARWAPNLQAHLARSLVNQGKVRRERDLMRPLP